MNRVLTVLPAIVLLLISCGEKEKIVEVPVVTNCPPAPPAGLFATNLDGAVMLCWFPNLESDVEGYDVYRWDSAKQEYEPIGTVLKASPEPAEYCFTDDEPSNGEQNYYAVSAYNTDGLLSVIDEYVSGTPRPQGSVTLYDTLTMRAESGYDISSFSDEPQPWSDESTDVYYVASSGGRSVIVSAKTTVDIQDYGYAGGFRGVNYAPADGWSPTRTVEAIPGHVYIVRLVEADGKHYAKLYVTEATTTFVTMLWAFQTDIGNRDLAPPSPGGAGPRTASYRDEAMPGLNLATRSTEVSATPPIVERVTWTRESRFEQQTTH